MQERGRTSATHGAVTPVRLLGEAADPLVEAARVVIHLLEDLDDLSELRLGTSIPSTALSRPTLV
jgi:hypothetical protein